MGDFGLPICSSASKKGGKSILWQVATREQIEHLQEDTLYYSSLLETKRYQGVADQATMQYKFKFLIISTLNHIT